MGVVSPTGYLPRRLSDSTVHPDPPSSLPDAPERVALLRRRRGGIPWLSLIGVLLLLFWAYWWTLNLIEGRLVAAEWTWVPWWDFLGVDFYHNWLAVRHWLAGGNPFAEDFGDPLGYRLNYMPIVLYVFAWTRLLDIYPAVIVWTIAGIGIFIAAAIACVRVRRELGLTPVPVPLAVALVLFATPVLFALERGNYDVLVLLMILLSVGALRRTRARTGEPLAGAFMGLAVFLKTYPLLVLPVLLIFRRRRALVCAVGVCLLLGVGFFRGNLAGLRNQQAVAEGRHGYPGWFGHSISGAWKWTTRDTPAAHVPGMVASAVMLAPLLAFVALRIRRAPPVDRDRLLLPALLFLTAAASAWTPIAMDYKLIFLPLAILSTWDRRDPWFVHVMVLPVLLYFQPLKLPIDVWPLFAMKVAGLVGAGLSLAAKTATNQAVIDPVSLSCGKRSG